MSEYRKSILSVLAMVLMATYAVSAEPLLKNRAFEEGPEAWKLPKPYCVERHGGRNGTSGLFYERTSSGDYALASQPVQLEPGKRYRFGAWIRTENVTNGTATVCVEFFRKNGQWMKGSYPIGVRNTSDWTFIGSDIRVSPYMDMTDVSFGLTLYMRKGATGKAWFDDVKLELDDRIISNLYVLDPSHERVTTQDGRITLRTYFESAEPEQLVCALSVSAGDIQREFREPVQDGLVSVDLGRLPEGKGVLRATLLSKNTEVASESFPLTITPPEQTLPANACMIDERGRAVVGNKPFLPVGLYMRNIHTNDLNTISRSPFNCLMPYQSTKARLAKNDRASIQTMHDALDYCYSKNIKVIFSIKDLYQGHRAKEMSWMGITGCDAIVAGIVREFRNHPALLAWYVNDETPEDKMQELIARRRLVNDLDPFHPTWAVLCQFDSLPMYGGSCDIVGVDPYPIRHVDTFDMKMVDRAMNAVDKTALRTWVVPQAHNIGVYRFRKYPEKFKQYRGPTEGEMRASSILLALRGAKGFVFYSYFDLTKRPLTQADYAKSWPALCRVGQMLRDLEPFLLSDSEPTTPDLDIEKGNVQATEFRDAAGNVRILVAGVGPGASRAIIRTTSAKSLKSLYGQCRALGDGAYEFRGDNICSDILSNE